MKTMTVMIVAMRTSIRMRMRMRMGMRNGMGIGMGVYGYACESVVQGGETCHLISLLARTEFIHPDDLEVTLGCYVNW